MLYNIELEKIHKDSECGSCKFFDKNMRKCNGINKVCFLYDEATKTIIDAKTKMVVTKEQLKGE